MICVIDSSTLHVFASVHQDRPRGFALVVPEESSAIEDPRQRQAGWGQVWRLGAINDFASGSYR